MGPEQIEIGWCIYLIYYGGPILTLLILWSAMWHIFKNRKQ